MLYGIGDFPYGLFDSRRKEKRDGREEREGRDGGERRLKQTTDGLELESIEHMLSSIASLYEGFDM